MIRVHANDLLVIRRSRVDRTDYERKRKRRVDDITFTNAEGDDGHHFLFFKLLPIEPECLAIAWRMMISCLFCRCRIYFVILQQRHRCHL